MFPNLHLFFFNYANDSLEKLNHFSYRIYHTVLVHLGYHNKTAISLGGSDDRHLFLIALGAGELKIKALADLVSAEDPLPGS